MARISVELPSALEAVVGGGRTIAIEAETIASALTALVGARPALEVHLFDESGEFRRHVLCFHNTANTRWLDDLNVPVADGDRIRILQAVSGG